jgi:predicted AAA+ superfamily ATPase
MKPNPDYHPRLVDSKLTKLLAAFGGVLIVGPKWCGKSWTGEMFAASKIEIDREDNRRLAQLLPEEALSGENPRLIDEWQDAPILWDAARRTMDNLHQPGLFIFTGSSTPRNDKPRHTGTGRFARLMMRPMSLFETGDSSGKITFSALFEGEVVNPQKSTIDAKQAIGLICKGGWPANLWLNEQASTIVPTEYLKSLVNEDINRPDGVKKNPRLASLLLRALARNSATQVKATTLRADINRDEDDLSEQSIRSYYDALLAIYVVVEQAAWLPSLRSKTRIRTTPKRHFVDPSLAVAALGASPGLLLRDIRTAGYLFESLCYRDFCVYADMLDGTVYHYRDESGLEADAIVALPDGRWGAIEVKLGEFEFEEAAQTLKRLKAKVLKDAGAPSFLAIVTASGGLAYTREDGVAVIPIDCLGP